MLRGLCPGCGELVRGWALLVPHYQMCDKCGLRYLVSENEKPFSDGVSRLGNTSLDAVKIRYSGKKIEA